MALHVDRFVSADSHVNEPDDLWVKRMDRRFRDDAPRMEMRDGAKTWVVKGLYSMPEDSPVLIATDEKHRDAMEAGKGGRHQQVRPGGLDPQLRLLDQDADHIAAEVLYPGHALLFFGITDADYQRECLRVYNDFISEFSAASPNRLLGVGILPFRGPLQWAISEAQRCAGLGLREVMIPNLPVRPYHDPYYQPLWDALENLGLPVVTHTATQEEQLDLATTSIPLNAWVIDEKIVNMMRCLSRLIAGGVP